MSSEKETLAKADEEETSRRKGFDKKLVSLALLFATQVFIGTVCLAYRSCDKQEQTQIAGSLKDNHRSELIIIHITGSVRKPGWFTFEPGARVIDAVTKAGGVLPNTDFSDVILTRLLRDGEKLVFARKKRF